MEFSTDIIKSESIIKQPLEAIGHALISRLEFVLTKRWRRGGGPGLKIFLSNLQFLPTKNEKSSIVIYIPVPQK